MTGDDQELTRLSSGFAICRVSWRIYVGSRRTLRTITCRRQVSG